MIRTSLAAILLAASAAGASAQAPADRRCTDDRGVNRCNDEQQRRMRALYGVPTIEEHQAAGEEVRRIFFVDGYGRDLILIAFIRSPGRDPELRVHHPRTEGNASTEPLRAPLSQEALDDIALAARHFDRSFVPLPVAGPIICSHAWLYQVETVERTRNPRQPTEVRRKIEDACDDGPTGSFAREAAERALALLPYCSALDRDHYRNAPTILATCRILHGDRLAAAEVLNLSHAFRQLSGSRDAPRIAAHFAHEAEIFWAGETWRGAGYRAGEQWTARLGQSPYPTNMYVQRVEGETGSRVRVTGQLSRTADVATGDGSGSETATVEQLWVRDINGEMRVERATVGRWRRSER